MQAVSAEHSLPTPLTCSGCRHWAQTLADTDIIGGVAGRCGRFAEMRPGTARPRCNICWEPALVTQSIADSVLADD